MTINYPIPQIDESSQLGPQIEVLRDCAAVMTADGVTTLTDHKTLAELLKTARECIIDAERVSALALMRSAASRMSVAAENPPGRLTRAVRQVQVRQQAPDVIGHADAVRTRFISNRDDLTRLWRDCEKRHADIDYSDKSVDGRLSKPFAHFPAGTALSEIFDWFKAEHARFDAVTPNVVEIRTPGRFFPARHQFEASSVTFAGEHVTVDGLDVPELLGKTIIGVRWISGHGSVKTSGAVRLCGEINGVMMNTTNAIAQAEPEEDDLGRAPGP